MQEQEIYKNILKKAIEETNANHIQSIQQLIHQLALEIDNQLHLTREKIAK